MSYLKRVNGLMDDNLIPGKILKVKPIIDPTINKNVDEERKDKHLGFPSTKTQIKEDDANSFNALHNFLTSMFFHKILKSMLVQTL